MDYQSPILLNIGSGQRPFEKPWLNLDCREQGYQVDIITDANDLSMFRDNSVSMIIAHHLLEHLDIGTLESYISEWYRVLQTNGELVIFVPNIPKLFEAWYNKKINNYILNVNLYGAYQGYPTDLHRWGYNEQELLERVYCINQETKEPKIKWSKTFYWNPSELKKELYKGADIGWDWWVLGMIFIK